MNFMLNQLKNFLFHQYSKLAAFFYGRAIIGYIEKKHRKSFQDIEHFCLFVGYPRSGHTIIGALLNAHPDAVIAHELNALEYVRKGIRKERLFAKLIARNKWFKARGFSWSGYSYKIPGQWQGKYKTLKVIGDKRGGKSSRLLHNNIQLLDKLKNTTGKNLKIIHITRNPFDNIATRARGGNYYNRNADNDRIMIEIDRHFREVESVDQIKKNRNYEMFDLKHEDFKSNPAKHLRHMCDFLGLTPYDDYINSCIKLIRPQKSKSRDRIKWTQEAIDEINTRIKKYPFLSEYTFEN